MGSNKNEKRKPKSAVYRRILASVVYFHLRIISAKNHKRKMTRNGYLYLQPGRGRDMHICLTPEGRRLVEEKAAPVAAMEERAFSGMPQEDQQALLRLTHAYLARLRAEAGRIL